MAALLNAQEPVARREQSALHALRQALVDLAAIAEPTATDLPAPAAGHDEISGDPAPDLLTDLLTNGMESGDPV